MYLKSLVYVLDIFLICANCVLMQQVDDFDYYDDYNEIDTDNTITTVRDTEIPTNFISNDETFNWQETDFSNKNLSDKNLSENQTTSQSKSTIQSNPQHIQNLTETQTTTEESLVLVQENRNISSKTLITSESKNNTKPKKKKKVDSSSSSLSTSTTTTSTTTTSTIISTTPTITIITTENIPNNTEAPSFWASFNLNYLYFLLLLIPIIGIIVGIVCFCKRRKRKGYKEPPNVRKTRRLSTPSWVFSEPESSDEEIVTLQEEKK